MVLPVCKEIENVPIELEETFRQINHVLNYFTKNYLTEKGISMARFSILSKIYPDRAITMGKLKRRSFQAPATLTGLVDGLVSDNLVKRWRDEADRRQVLLALTDKGKSIVDGALQFRAAIIDLAARDLVLSNDRLLKSLGLLQNRLKHLLNDMEE